jgi:hypothetical protein
VPSARNPIVSLILDGRLWKGPAPWIAVMFLLSNVAVARREQVLRQQRDENLLRADLQKKTTDAVPRFDWSTGENLAEYLPYIPDARKRPLVVVSGMSQMYAINEKIPGDKTISELLDDDLARSGIRAFGLAAPNLDNEEAVLLLLASLAKPETHPRVFVYGVCFDKFRNVDLRPGYLSLLASHPALQSRWRAACTPELTTKYPVACEKMARSLESARETAAAQPDDIEHRLRNSVAKVVPAVGSHTELNAALTLQAFLFRNWLFDIKPTSKRPIIGSRYELNQQFLGMLADLARANGVEPMFYVIPLNPLADNPYIPEQYQQFKTSLARFVEERHIPFANLENEVPSPHWGEFMDGPDFKHFKGEGHRTTAAAILREFKPAIVAARGAAGR